MLKLTYRQLIYDPYRSFLTCVAISSALAVILLIEGFRSGLLVQLGNVSVNRGADLIVAQSGVSNFVASRSLLPQLSRDRIESVDGVINAHPITMIPIIYEQEGYRKNPIFFVVYDTFGGPSKLVKGSVNHQPRDIVIDESLAVLYDLTVGDLFVVADFEFVISGIAENASALFTAFSFIKYDDMIDFFFDSDLVGDFSSLPLLSYLLVELDSNVDALEVAKIIEQIEPDGDVYLPEQLSKNDMALGDTLFGPVINVLIGASYVVALLVVGMIMFATVHARLRSYGVIKALGFSNGSLIRQMVLESIILIVLAFPISLLLASIGSLLIESVAPLYRVQIMATDPVLKTLIASLLIGMAGAYLPYRLVANIDPAVVFRG